MIAIMNQDFHLLLLLLQCSRNIAFDVVNSIGHGLQFKHLASPKHGALIQGSGHIPGALNIDGDIAVLHDRLTSDVFQSVLKAASSSNRQPVLAHKTLPSM